MPDGRAWNAVIVAVKKSSVPCGVYGVEYGVESVEFRILSLPIDCRVYIGKSLTWA